MKKYIFLAITLFAISFASAQYKPIKGTSGLGINYRLSSNVNFPVIKYDNYLTDSWVLSAFYKPGFTASSFTTESDQNGTEFNRTTQSRYSQSIGIQIEKHFFDKSRIDPFVGAYLSHGFSSKSKSSSVRETVNSIGSTYYDKNENTTPIANSFVPALNLGLNYFILNNFSLGLQLDLGNSFYFVNGNAMSNSITRITDNQGNVILEDTFKSSSKIKETRSNLFYSVNLKAAFYFQNKKADK